MSEQLKTKLALLDEQIERFQSAVLDLKGKIKLSTASEALKISLGKCELMQVGGKKLSQRILTPSCSQVLNAQLNQRN